MPDPPHHCSTLLLEIINLKPPLEASVPSLRVCQLVSEFKSRHHGFSTQCCLSLHMIHGHRLHTCIYMYMSIYRSIYVYQEKIHKLNSLSLLEM